MQRVRNVSHSCKRERIVSNYLQLNGVQTSMKVGTCATATSVTKPTRESLMEILRRIDRTSTAKVRCQTHAGELVKVLGTGNVVVKYELQEVELQTLVVEGSGPNLL